MHSRYFIIFSIPENIFFCSPPSFFLSNKRPDLIAYEILGQEKEEDHVWLKVNVVFYLECVSFFHSGDGGTDEAVFHESGSFLF